LREQQKAASEGVSLFSEKGMPAYCIARMSGKDIYEVWNSLTNGGTLFVRMAIGTHEEQAKERELAAKYEGIVLDPIALFTFAALGQLPNLKRFYSRVVVPFPLYERLKRMSDELNVGNEATGVIQLAPDGEHIFLNEDVRAHYAKKRDFLGRIVEFLESGTVERAGFFPPEGLNDAGEFLETCRSSAFAAVCIAKAENLGLVSDDIATRQLAKMALGVDSFCSQRVIEVAAEKGTISAEEQYIFVIGLFEHNYSFVSDSPDMLGFFFRRNGWQIDTLARRIVERFDTGKMHHISASRIYGTIMADGWLQSKDSGAWLRYFCERLQSSGDVEENFRWAAIGAMQALADAPEIFFALTMRIREIDWIEREARESFVLAFRAAEMVFGKENTMMPSACPSRWRKVVQTMRKGDSIKRLLAKRR
jgi:predicted nucleic acid-binding protein